MVGSHAVDPPAPRPGEAESLNDLSATLVALRAWAGSPSFTEIARRIRQLRTTRPGAGIDQPPGRVTVYDCFREGRRRLDIDLVSDIVTVLGAPDDVPHWQRAHARIEAEAQSSSVARVLDALPAPGIRLVGREAELHRLVRSDRPVTAVVGMPGVGKTELALHTAAALADDHDLHLFVTCTATATTCRPPTPVRCSAASCGISECGPPASGGSTCRAGSTGSGRPSPDAARSPCSTTCAATCTPSRSWPHSPAPG